MVRKKRYHDCRRCGEVKFKAVARREDRAGGVVWRWNFATCRVVSQTDMLLPMPERYARIANQQFCNQILPIPTEMPPLDIYLYWYTNVDNDPANRWLREQLIQSFQR